MITIFLLAWIGVLPGQQQNHAATVALEALGRRRDEFGDIEPKNDIERQIYIRTTFDSFPTRILFPSGKADERFYLNEGGLSLSGTKNDHYDMTLQCETHRSGRAKLEWVIPLDPFSSVDAFTFKDMKSGRPIKIPKALRNSGTMVMLLYKSGYKLHGMPTKPIQARLNKREGYACYSLLRPLGSYFYYWYVDKQGHFSDQYQLDLSQVVHRDKSVVNFGFQLGEPYPMTGEEKESMGYE